MRSISKLAAFASFVILFSSSAFAATVTGTVKGPDGAPFEGAFVQAVNAKTKISVSVLSDKQGRYRVENLPAGEYQVRVRAVGFTTEPHSAVSLAADQNISFEFRAETRDGALERPESLSGQAAHAGWKRKRHSLDQLLYLPRISNQDGRRSPRRGWLARPRQLHAGRHGISIVREIQRRKSERGHLVFEYGVWRRLNRPAKSGGTAGVQGQPCGRSATTP